MWHCPHSPAAASERLCCCGSILGQTDGQTPYRYIDPTLRTVWAVSITVTVYVHKTAVPWLQAELDGDCPSCQTHQYNKSLDRKTNTLPLLDPALLSVNNSDSACAYDSVPWLQAELDADCPSCQTHQYNSNPGRPGPRHQLRGRGHCPSHPYTVSPGQ